MTDRLNQAGDRRSTEESRPTTKITFWTFRKCDKSYCKDGYLEGHTRRPHLIIETVDMEPSELAEQENVEQKANFAISYAWGRKPHRERYLGHSENGKQHFKVELGQEWKMEGFVNRLASLSNHSPGELRKGWLDQLRQKDLHKDNVINYIPLIYRSCEIFALFPGKPCSCINPSHHSTTQIANNIPLRPALSQQPSRPECLNYVDLVSWWGRLWPRQEFMYANKISVTWTSEAEHPQCVYISESSDETHKPQLTGRQIKSLTKLCRMHFEEFFWLQARSRTGTPCGGACRSILWRHPWQALGVLMLFLARDKSSPLKGNALINNTRLSIDSEATCPCALALDKFTTYQASHLTTMQLSIEEKLHGQDSQNGLRNFLGGSPIEAGASSSQPQPSVDDLHLFTKHIGLLGRAHRQATQAGDLVKAVWPDCPQYEFKSGGDDYRVLLGDAVNQMQMSWGRALITTAPRGLFSMESDPVQKERSWEWDPLLHLQLDHDHLPKTTSYVYGTIAAPFLTVPILEDENETSFIAIEFKENDYSPLSEGAMSFEQKYPGVTERDVVRDFLTRVVREWPKDVVNRCQGPEVLSLGHMLRKKNPFLWETVLPLMAEESAWKLTEFIAPKIRRFISNKELQKSLVARIAGKEYQEQILEILTNIREGVEGVEESIEKYTLISVPKHRKLAKMWIKNRVIKTKAKRLDKIMRSKPYQTIRDQKFFDHVVRPKSTNQPSERNTQLADASGETASKESVNEDHHKVNHIDLAYYLVSEALGIRPQDIGVDYEESWASNGGAYKNSKLKLMVSGGEPPMLGFTTFDPDQLGQRNDGDIRTVAFQNRIDPVNGEDTKYGNLLYEVQRRPGDENTWRIIGVWVPVISLPPRVCSGWFGENARAHGRLY